MRFSFTVTNDLRLLCRFPAATPLSVNVLILRLWSPLKGTLGHNHQQNSSRLKKGHKEAVECPLPGSGVSAYTSQIFCFMVQIK